MRLVCYTIFTVIFLSFPSSAGPYFNSPNSAIAENLNAAVRNINEARVRVIRMLDFWETNTDQAASNRDEAIDFLKTSRNLISGMRPSKNKIEYNFNYTPAELQAIDSFRAIIVNSGIEIPETEEDLFKVTYFLIQRYIDTLSETEISEFPEAWENSRRVLIADINLVLIGSAISILSKSTI